MVDVVPSSGAGITPVADVPSSGGSNVVLSVSEVTCPVGDVTCSVGDVTCSVGDVTCSVGDVTCPVGDVTCSVGDVTCPVPGAMCSVVSLGIDPSPPSTSVLTPPPPSLKAATTVHRDGTSNRCWVPRPLPDPRLPRDKTGDLCTRKSVEPVSDGVSRPCSVGDGLLGVVTLSWSSPSCS